MRAKLLHPGTILGTISLIVALGGTSYAVSALPRNSIGTKQLRSNSVTSGKVRNGSLLAKDFRAGQLPGGPQGPAGAPGPAGPQGPPGISGLQVVSRRRVPAKDWTAVEVMCPAGKEVVGGGAEALGQTTVLRRSSPNAAGTGWTAVKGNSAGEAWLNVWAICAHTS